MYSRIGSTISVWLIFHLHNSLTLGFTLKTSIPEEGQLHIPYLIKLPPSKSVHFNSVKPLTACADIYFSTTNSYPLQSDHHIFICRDDFDSPLGTGFISHGLVAQQLTYKLKSGTALRKVSVTLDDFSNSITLEDLNQVFFTYTFNHKDITLCNFQYFALSGDAEWEIFQNDFDNEIADSEFNT